MDTSKKIPSKDYYLRQALKNLQIISRAAKGVVDVSASVEKVKVMQESVGAKETAGRATVNFKEVIEELYEQRNRKFENPEELQAFIEDIARHINKGITKRGTLIRSYDSERYPYTKVKDLPKEMKQFYEELFARLQNPSEDPKSLLAG